MPHVPTAALGAGLFRPVCSAICLFALGLSPLAEGQTPRYGQGSGVAQAPGTNVPGSGVNGSGVTGAGATGAGATGSAAAPERAQVTLGQGGQAAPAQYGQAQSQPSAPQYGQPTQPAQPATGQQPAMEVQPVVPVNPFNVSAAEQAWIHNLLVKWEKDSEQVKTFYCEFERDVYNQFGPPGRPMNLERGKVGFIAPDKGSFEITETKTWTPASVAPGTDPAQAPPGEYKVHEGVKGDHWVCDGEFLYEHRFNTEPKQLVVTPIPPGMQGKEIVNGPLPFLFGAKADDLEKRYWFRVAKELCDEKYTRIGIHAKPKYQTDLANFTDVFVVLRNEPNELLMPMALRMVDSPRDHQQRAYSYSEYRFNLRDARVNARLDKWFSGMFLAPRTPRGWVRVEEGLQQAQQLPPATGGEVPRQ